METLEPKACFLQVFAVSFRKGNLKGNVSNLSPLCLQRTLPETNIAPKHRPSQKETSIPTIHFLVRAVSFREGKPHHGDLHFPKNTSPKVLFCSQGPMVFASFAKCLYVTVKTASLGVKKTNNNKTSVIFNSSSPYQWLLKTRNTH